ncbi:hypothetical protein SAMN06265173_103230 [Thalassovita litoralis]|uniref:Uncharacterized protein n=1 Tax=Thalassovita litoralis TaxID=1010611 RepID=A0A521BP46_9RHOB|nr:hypothetical protein SAMN06265173_103230 [Thalassovita litoralis]
MTAKPTSKAFRQPATQSSCSLRFFLIPNTLGEGAKGDRGQSPQSIPPYAAEK